MSGNVITTGQLNLKVFLVLFLLLLAGCQGTAQEVKPSPTQTSIPTQPTTSDLAVATSTESGVATSVNRERYLGQPAPENLPEIFLPGLVSTEGIELFFALHPNLKEIYFTRVSGGRSMILVTYFDAGQWTEPTPAPFSSDFQDVGPFITLDGQQLYFWSNRPLTPTTPLMTKHQIWLVEREGDAWGEPKNLDLPLESRDGEWDVSVTADGRIYYMAHYPSLGGSGLYWTQEVDGSYQMPEKVDALSNEGTLIELEPVISPDGRFMIFYSVGREDNLTPDARVGDLYISFRQPSGKWSEPQNLGTPINSEAEEATPALSPDGRFLFFASNRNAPTKFPDIYWVSIEAIAGLFED